MYGVADYFEMGVIIVVIIMVVQILAWLFCSWSVHIQCLLTCSKVRGRKCYIRFLFNKY